MIKLILSMTIGTLLHFTSAFAAVTQEGSVYKLEGIDAALPSADLEPFAKIIKGARVVGLGESVHTSRGYYQAKFRLIRYLVEKQGFRFVTMETPWITGLAATRYVETCVGTPTMASKSLQGVFQDVATRDMLEWLCQFNQAHPNDKVVFYGYDNQEVEVYPLIVSTLKDNALDRDGRLGQDLHACLGMHFKSTSEFYASPEGKAIIAGQPIDSGKSQTCIRTLEQIDRALENLSVGAKSREKLLSSRIAVTSGIAFEKLFERASNNDMAISFQARDVGMAKSFILLHELVGKNRKAINWAHNGHLQMSPAIYPSVGGKSVSVRVMGNLLKDHYGSAYMPFALSAFRVLINWYWTHIQYSEFPVTTASIETFLHDRKYEYAFVDFLGFRSNSPAQFMRDGQPVSLADYRGMFFLDFSPGNIFVQ